MSYYVHYKGQKYDASPWQKEEYLLRWCDEDRIPKGFESLDTPTGWVKAKKIIHWSEADCAYREDIMVNYKGYDFFLRDENEDQLLIAGLSNEKESKAAGLGFREPGVYEKYISRNEGSIWFNIKPLPPSYEGKCKQEYLTYRLGEDGYSRGEYYANYRGQIYRMKPEYDFTYILYWYDDNDIPEGFELYEEAGGKIKAIRRVYSYDVKSAYREYIMATYNGGSFYVIDLAEDQVLIQGIEEADSKKAGLKKNEKGLYEGRISRKDCSIWVRREIL